MVSPHGLRRAVVYYTLDPGAPVHVVQQALSHAAWLRPAAIPMHGPPMDWRDTYTCDTTIPHPIKQVTARLPHRWQAPVQATLPWMTCREETSTVMACLKYGIVTAAIPLNPSLTGRLPAEKLCRVLSLLLNGYTKGFFSPKLEYAARDSISFFRERKTKSVRIRFQGHLGASKAVLDVCSALTYSSG